VVFTGTAEAESKNKPFGKAKRGTMNRSVRRVMMGVAGLAVLGMTATLAGAQTVVVKEKPPLYRYVSYWTFPRAHWADVDKDNATGNQKILAPALADGALVGYGDDENQVHSAEGLTHDNWWQANSIAGWMKVLEAFHNGGGSSSPLLVSSTKHWDQIYISSFYNWKAGSWKGAYGYAGTYKLKPDAPDADDAVRALSSYYVPVFEKMLADGTIVEYEIDSARIYRETWLPSARCVDRGQRAYRTCPCHRVARSSAGDRAASCGSNLRQTGGSIPLQS
jgi:hypothetical protein